MSITVTLDTSRLDTLIRQLDERVDSAVNDAGEDLAEMVRGEIRSMNVIDTGRLLASTAWKPTAGAGGIVEVPAKSNRGFPYPVAQHEGWTDRGGGWHTGRPFMRVAVERFKPYFQRNYFGKLFD